MLLLFFILVFFVSFLFLFRPLLFLLGSKIFRIEQITYKKCLVVSLLTYALGIFIAIAAYIVSTLFPGLYSHLVIFNRYDILSLFGSFVVTIWVIKKKIKTTYSQSIGISAIFFVAVLTVVFLINFFLIQSYVIPTSSMKPTLLIGDRIIVNKFIYYFKEPAKGDVIAFKHPLKPSQIYTKRVIALAGERIRIYKKQVFINGQPFNEPYVNLTENGSSTTDEIHNFPPGDANKWAHTFPIEYRKSVIDTDKGKAFIVPEGHCFCLGENRDFSYDCRSWGPLPVDHIIGKAWGIYWSRESTTEDYFNFGLWPKIKKIFLSVPNFFLKTRWNRIGRSIQ
ncbi:signal peptidase I [Acidobacteriota bacterium]